jgi:hypothetical protein
MVLSVHAGQGALQRKISTFLVVIVPTSALNMELRDSRTIVFSRAPFGPYTALSSFVQTPRELILPKQQRSLVGNTVLARWGEMVCHRAPGTPPLHF